MRFYIRKDGERAIVIDAHDVAIVTAFGCGALGALCGLGLVEVSLLGSAVALGVLFTLGYPDGDQGGRDRDESETGAE